MSLLGLNSNFSEAMGIRWLAKHQSDIATSLQRLATGKKLNKASDDPGGLVDSEGLKSEQVTVLSKIKTNQREALRYSAIEGGLSVVADMLNDLKSDIVTSANTGGVSETERQGYQIDVNSIVDTLGDLANTTLFNGEQILAPYIGAGAHDGSGGNIAGSLGALRTGGKFNLVNGDLEGASKFVDAMISGISTTRAGLGANQKSIEHENNELMTRNENLAAAISQIVDTDYASEVGSLVRSQALAEAATFAIQTARDLQAQSVLALIRNQPIGLGSGPLGGHGSAR